MVIQNIMMNKSNIKPPIELFDTTLRDGTQGEGVNLSVDDKLHIATNLDGFGINIIEGGWPGSNPRDMEFFKRAKTELKLKQATIAAFGSTARSLKSVTEDTNLNDLLKAETEIVTIFGKTWALHSKEGLGLAEDENAELILRSVEFLAKAGRRVIFDAEHFYDGYKDSSKFSIKMIKAAIEGGADTIVLCDTNGGSLPKDISKATKYIKEKFDIQVGVHVHNDGGLAVANTLAAVEAGATHVQGTINGVGERCGNVSLGSVIPNLILKMDRDTLSPLTLENLTPLTQYIYDIMNLHAGNQAPFVGKSAFAHKGGIHVSAVMKNNIMYEHINPKIVGNQRRVLVSDLSGRSNIYYKATELNIPLGENNNLPRELVQKIKKLEYDGYQFEAAEASLELIMQEALGTYTPYFEVIDSRINMSYDQEGHRKADAMLKVSVNGEIEHTIADGNGPVNALSYALRKSLQRFYPQLKTVKLTDYKVRVLDGQHGTNATVRVQVDSSDGEINWSTIGVSENIIEASWQALRDSFNYKLLKSLSNNKSKKNDKIK